MCCVSSPLKMDIDLSGEIISIELVRKSVLALANTRLDSLISGKSLFSRVDLRLYRRETFCLAIYIILVKKNSHRTRKRSFYTGGLGKCLLYVFQSAGTGSEVQNYARHVNFL